MFYPKPLMHLTPVLVSLAIFLPVAGLAAQTKVPKSRGLPMLSVDHPVSGTLTLGENDGWYNTFEFTVPDDTGAFRLALSGATADLDLYIQKNNPPQDYSLADWFSELVDWNEEMLVTALGQPELTPGIYYVDVAYALDELPRGPSGQFQHSVPFQLELELLPLTLKASSKTASPKVLSLILAGVLSNESR